MLASPLMLLYYYYSKKIVHVNNNFGGVEMINQDIRRTAAGAGVKLWQIADALGIADCSLSRKLRKELPQEEKDRIFKIIKELSQEAR